MHKWIVALGAALLVFSGSFGARAAPAQGDGHRIVLSGKDAAAAGLKPRHKLMNGRVSAHVTDAQLTALERRGVVFERVPVRWVSAPPADQPTKPDKPGKGDGKGNKSKPGRSSLPPTQVPYGIKLIYGDPDLTAAQVNGGAGVTVAVLDTGTASHPDFTRADGTSVITDCVDFSQKKVAQVEGECKDDHGHGTHVTGIVAAAGGADGLGIFGVAPEANIFSYKVADRRGRVYADDVARAIRVAADRGADIITMSFGAPEPSVDEREAIRYAVSKGVLVIAAAGNRGPEADTIAYPAAFAEVVAVASLNPDETVSWFSSRGTTNGDDATIADREVEVAAPGRSVISTAADGGYVAMSGTSMATPHIAGLAAKMWQGSASRTRDWLVSRAAQHDIVTAEQADDADPGYDIASGYGLPQVQTAVQSLWQN